MALALLLIAAWMAFALALGALVVWPVGTLVTVLLPTSQRMLPPRIARQLLFWGALLLMAPAGCRTGVLASAIHAGDSVAGIQAAGVPWPTTILGASAVREESRSFLPTPMTPLGAGRLAARLWFGDWWDLADFTIPIIKASRSNTSYAGAWTTARPAVERALHRAIVSTYIMTAFVAILCLLAITLLFLLIRIETIRVQRPTNP